MVDCPRCGESVEADDTHCSNCRTDLRARGARPGDVILVLDRGLVQFGKLVLSVLGIFLVIGAFVVGFDLNKLVHEMHERRAELAVAREQISNMTRETKQSVSQLSQSVGQAEQRVAAAAAELERRVEDAKVQVDDLKAKVAEADGAIKIIRSARARVEVAVSGILNLSAERIATIEAQTTVEVPKEPAVPNSAKLFPTGTILKYAFVDQASAEIKKVVEDAIGEWEKYANLEFRFVSDPKIAEIRIGLKRGNGSWSFVGRDALNVPVSSPTMNFGWDITEPRHRDTAISEFGHVLGFRNEHQNPRNGIVWDEKAVYAHYSQAPNNWPDQTTELNVLRKLRVEEYPCTRSYDPDSIMMFPFPSGLTVDGAAITPKPGLSESDKACAREMYPR